jgi:hypothetical protein
MLNDTFERLFTLSNTALKNSKFTFISINCFFWFFCHDLPSLDTKFKGLLMTLVSMLLNKCQYQISA